MLLTRIGGYFYVLIDNDIALRMILSLRIMLDISVGDVLVQNVVALI